MKLRKASFERELPDFTYTVELLKAAGEPEEIRLLANSISEMWEELFGMYSGGVDIVSVTLLKTEENFRS